MGVLGDAPRASAICLCHAEQSSCEHTPANKHHQSQLIMYFQHWLEFRAG